MLSHLQRNLYPKPSKGEAERIRGKSGLTQRQQCVILQGQAVMLTMKGEVSLRVGPMACIPNAGPTRPIVTGIQRLLPVHSTPCNFPSSSLTSRLHAKGHDVLGHAAYKN